MMKIRWLAMVTSGVLLSAWMPEPVHPGEDLVITEYRHEGCRPYAIYAKHSQRGYSLTYEYFGARFQHQAWSQRHRCSLDLTERMNKCALATQPTRHVPAAWREDCNEQYQAEILRCRSHYQREMAKCELLTLKENTSGTGQAKSDAAAARDSQRRVEHGADRGHAAPSDMPASQWEELVPSDKLGSQWEELVPSDKLGSQWEELIPEEEYDEAATRVPARRDTKVRKNVLDTIQGMVGRQTEEERKSDRRRYSAQHGGLEQPQGMEQPGSGTQWGATAGAGQGERCRAFAQELQRQYGTGRLGNVQSRCDFAREGLAMMEHMKTNLVRANCYGSEYDEIDQTIGEYRNYIVSYC